MSPGFLARKVNELEGGLLRPSLFDSFALAASAPISDVVSDVALKGILRRAFGAYCDHSCWAGSAPLRRLRSFVISFEE